MSIFGGYYNHGEPAFTTCILKVDYRTWRWQKAVRGVLKSSWGVRSFKMDENGIVEVSGIIDPYVLLRKLRRAGRAAELCYWQFGQCSDNLFLPYANSHHAYGGAAIGYHGDGRCFPFRGGGHLYSLGYDHDTCSFPRTTPYSEETVGCCSVM